MKKLEEQTRALMESYAFEDATPEKVLAELAITMAVVTDKAVAKGQAQQASTSALQLRQSLADLLTLLKERDQGTDNMSAFLLEMKGAA